MTKILSFLIIISVLVIGVFGFTSMNHGEGHFTGCIALSVDNTPCLENIAAMSVHHIQALVSFFSVVPSIPLVFLLVLLFSLFLSTRFIYIKYRDLILTNLVFGRVRHDPERQLNRPRKITRWLSLLENSPSLHRATIIISNLIYLCKQKITNIIKFMTQLIQTWHSIWSAVWSLIQTALRQARITRVKPIPFALSTVRITL